MKDKLTIEASLFTAYPGFREVLPLILDALASKGSTYPPELVEYKEAGKIQSLWFNPEKTIQIAKLWKDMPFSSMLTFQKSLPVWVCLEVVNTLNNFNSVGMSIERHYLGEIGKPDEFLGLLKELYNIIHPMYGRVLSQETVRWFDDI
jgi:hypothetical protein